MVAMSTNMLRNDMLGKAILCNAILRNAMLGNIFHTMTPSSNTYPCQKADMVVKKVKYLKNN